MTSTATQGSGIGLTEGAVARAIYFFHDSTTTLPVRDMTTRDKLEPHIEFGHDRGLNDGVVIGAENFCNKCYQRAVQRLLRDDEEYLFLVTYPKHPDIEPKANQIVGYIRNQEQRRIGEGHLAVVGEMKLYKFNDAVPASEFGKRPSGPLGKWGETYTEDQTEEIVTHFEGCSDVTDECLRKTLELKEPDVSISGSDCGC